MTKRKLLKMRHHPKVELCRGYRVPTGHVLSPKFPAFSSYTGKFFVEAEVVIGIQKFQIHYLHKDGRWRPGAVGGYYDTKKEAREALRRARDTYFVSETYRLHRFRRSQ